MGKIKDFTFNFLPIFLVLIFAAFLRLPTFFLAHTNFDEMAYLSLALKLDKYGFKDFKDNFNLRYIEIGENGYFKAPFIGQRSKGNLVIGSSVDYEYRTPTHRPPGFSFLLVLFRRIFANDSPYLVSGINFNPYYSQQFYACFIPFIFSLLFILCTYLLGRMLFSEEIGVYAALFLSVTPTDLLVSNKIWAEAPLGFFTVLTVIFYFLSIRRKKIVFSLLSGICAGIAILIKLSGGFIVIIILFYQFWLNRFNLTRINAVFKSIFNTKFIVYIFAIITISGPWLYIYTQTHGYAMPNSALAPILTPWLKFIGSRPWYVYLINIPSQFPIYLLIYFSIISIFSDREKRDELLFLFLWFLIILLILSFQVWHKEDRYMMPAYPAIAILASFILWKLRLYLNKFNAYFGEVVFYCVIILSSIWSLKLSIPLVLSRQNLLVFPL